MFRDCRRVLVVDDDSIACLAIDRQLDVLGWDAYPVDSGKEAILVMEQGLDFSVVLTDICLPDWRAIADAAQRLSPQAGIIFMSRAPRTAQLTPRHAPFLLKPFSTAALADALRVALRFRDVARD